MRFRAALPADAATLAALQEEASLEGAGHVFPPELYPFPAEAVRGRWEEFTAAGGWAVIAEDEGRAIGFAAVRPPWFESIYVLPQAWGSGVAGTLHDRAIEALAAAGVERARLWVLEQNARARAFYERRGWRLDGTTRLVPFPPHPLDVGYALRLKA